MTAAKKISPHNSHPEEIITHLRGVGLFTDIASNQAALEQIARLMQELHFQAGEDIIREGDSGTNMFILTQGRASVYKAPPQGEEYKVAIFDGAKHVAFGESGLIEADNRSATIRADTACICLALERVAFEKFSNEHPEWALPVYRRIAFAVMARLKKTNNDMLLLYNALVAEIRGN